ncbi:uncharacterized protein LOC128961536 [Oppia nitens]|uniref:uncharacterized protein LOC128961536 n=1 Tax=Oppia nitens TaxID=1686743 RepID=UPI0023DC66A7|nr:uncharacterized protein LOC128961536 [Oppia nitens]
MSFGGWRPLKTNPNPSAAEAPLDSHFLTVPVAVETDAEHELSETEISRIRQHIINNWKNAPKKQESFGSHVRQVVEKLIPKPEVELHVDDDRTTAQSRVSSDVSSDASSDMLSSETTNE